MYRNQAIGLENSQVYVDYQGQINHYQSLISRADEDVSATTIAYYQDEIARYQKLQLIAQQKEALRGKAFQKVTEFKQEVKSMKDSQAIVSENIASSFKQSSNADYKDVIDGESSEKFKIVIADISIETDKLDSQINEFCN